PPAGVRGAGPELHAVVRPRREAAPPGSTARRCAVRLRRPSRSARTLLRRARQVVAGRVLGERGPPLLVGSRLPEAGIGDEPRTRLRPLAWGGPRPVRASLRPTNGSGRTA